MFGHRGTHARLAALARSSQPARGGHRCRRRNPDRGAQLAVDHPEIREFDIDPLLAGASGVMAVDARLRVAPPQPGPARLAISPYPKEFEATESLRDGAVVNLHPVRPENELLLQDLASHLSPEDLRLRFFTVMRGLTHQFAARLTQIN